MYYMNETDLQLSAFSFVNKIVELNFNDENNNTYKDWSGSSSHLSSVDLSSKVTNSPVIIQQFMTDLSDYKIYIGIGDKKYGLLEVDYKPFYEFVYKVSEWKNLQQKVSIEYLKTKILLWVVNIYIQKKCNIEFLNYLEELLSKDVNRYKFYFPILNIDIEKDFNIGDAKITFFSKEYFDELYSTMSESGEIKKKHFNKAYRKYQGQVFIAINVNAEKRKAEEIAYEQGCYVADILKLCGPSVQFPNFECYLELESRIPFSYDFISFKNENKYDFSITTKMNRSQSLPFNNEFIKDYEIVFNTFGKLIDKTKLSEIELLVRNSIIFLSKSLSEKDLHLRVSQLIMIIESLFLNDDEKYKMENKCKKRFSFFLFHPNLKETNEFIDVLSEMYQVRHKMTHKSIRIFIDVGKLRLFQIYIITALDKIINNSSEYQNKQQLISSLEIETES